MGLTGRARLTGWVVVLAGLTGVVFSAPNQPAAHLGSVLGRTEAAAAHRHADAVSVVEAPEAERRTPEGVDATEVSWLPDGHSSYSHSAHADDGVPVVGPASWTPLRPVGPSGVDGGVPPRQRELTARPG